MTKGKNFSGNNVTGKRKKSDFYETPYSMTQKLLDNEIFSGVVLEPSCGNGAIVKVLTDNNYNVVSKDISTGHDFLDENNMYESIITNPPFSLAKEFITKCSEICTGKYALLLPLSYLHGKSRFDLFYKNNKICLKFVYVFTRSPMLGEELRNDGKYHTGMMVYAWFVFENNYNGEPAIRWIDNNEDVISKND